MVAEGFALLNGRPHRLPAFTWRRGMDPAGLANADAALKHGLVHDDLRAAVFAGIDDPANCATVMGRLAKIPQRWQWRAWKAWVKTRAARGWTAAHVDMAGLANAFGAIKPEVWQSDSSLNDYAEVCAAGVVDWLISHGAGSTDSMFRELKNFAAKNGVKAPEVDTLKGAIERMKDSKWWRRALRKSVIRTIEAAAIKLGYVHRRASLYASVETIGRRGQQKRRNARTLAGVTLENESGQAFTLADLAERNVSNAAIRRAELMTRISGFQEYAEGKDHASLFFTITAPSRFHARYSATGQANPRYDGSTPRDAQAHLSRQWGRARARLGRLGIFPYGFRVAEPHHDGAPHWHILLFVHRECVGGLVDTLRRYAFQIDGAELNSDAARRARFDWKEITAADGASGAAGYIAKYVAKNIDGFQVGAADEGSGEDAASTVANVDAWASTWGIRQFQQIGGPGVTIWRELRRLQESPQLPLFETFHAAANAGAWADYVAAQGGIEIRRRDRPCALWKTHSDAENAYGEDRAAVVEGVRLPWKLEHCRTRFHTWAAPEQWAIHRREHGAGTYSGLRHDAAGISGDGGMVRPAREQRNGGGLDRGEPGAAPLAGNGDGVGLYGNAAGAGARAVDFEVALPWSRVNNCTGRYFSDTYSRREAMESLRAATGRARDAIARITAVRGSGPPG